MMTNNKVAIIIPLYKEKLSPLEEISISRCFQILSKYQIIAIKPKSLGLGEYRFKFDDIVSFDDEFFTSIEAYNKLMLSPSLYQKFLNYEFILIHQTDAFVFEDSLFFWCQTGYDYIGAPWLKHAAYPDPIKKIKSRVINYLHVKKNIMQPNSYLPTDIQFENRVGNGGLSLRNTKKFYNISIQEKDIIAYYNSKKEHYFNEDVFWSIEVNRKNKRLSIPNYTTAAKFSLENNASYGLELTNGELPFGCHAWDRSIDFWAPIFAKFDINIKNDSLPKLS